MTVELRSTPPFLSSLYFQSYSKHRRVVKWEKNVNENKVFFFLCFARKFHSFCDKKIVAIKRRRKLKIEKENCFCCLLNLTLNYA